MVELIDAALAGVYFRMKDSGAASFAPRDQILSFCGGERVLPVKITMRQRPLDLRSSWKCQGRASDWLRTFTEGMRVPRASFETRCGLETAASVLEDETSVPSPWMVEEPSFATMREAP